LILKKKNNIDLILVKSELKVIVVIILIWERICFKLWVIEYIV